MTKKITSHHWILVGLMDVAAFVTSYALAFLLRFDFRVPPFEWECFFFTVWLVAGMRSLSFFYFGTYQGVWRYASMADLTTLVKAIASSQIAIVASVLLLRHGQFPRSVLFIDPVIALILVGFIRFSIRATRELRYQHHTEDMPRLLIFGAGDLGESIVRDMHRRKPRTYHIVGFVDDDRSKWNHRIHGVPILGGRKDLPKFIERHQIEEVIVAVSHSRGQIIKDLMDICQHSRGRKVQFKTIPTIEENLRTDSSRRHGIRKIELSDLLRRKPVKTDLNSVKGILEGKNILVTGAGGSIGSELCRQILRFKPAKLLLLEKHNTALFYIDRELNAQTSTTVRLPISGDVGDETLLDRIFHLHKPQVVFHAAAHKHVPLMESNPHEAVKNNTLNTHLLAEKAANNYVERFLNISTDKAVRPANIMGASKRMGEMVIRAFTEVCQTRFISVRFGNVLGSSGSAINIFKEQISSGGPITVTHPDVTRYFMTTEEAVQLILQATAMGKGGEIFVLNMGDPVKVVDVAHNLVLLSGLVPEKDIKIVFTGMRPGEKMYEELFRPNDVRKDTGHPDIFAALPEEAELSILRSQLTDFKKLCAMTASDPLIAKIKELVPAYTGFPHINGKAVPPAPATVVKV